MGVVLAAFLAVGLFVPALRPLAFQVGTALSLAFIAAGIGVALYAAWRIATFPYRRRRAWLRSAEIRSLSHRSSLARPAAAEPWPGRRTGGFVPRRPRQAARAQADFNRKTEISGQSSEVGKVTEPALCP